MYFVEVIMNDMTRCYDTLFIVQCHDVLPCSCVILCPMKR